MSVMDDGITNDLSDDHETESPNMVSETWRFANANTSTVLESKTLVQQAFKNYQDYLNNKPFMKHQAQVFEQFPLAKGYLNEQSDFLKTVAIFPKHFLPADENIIGSHTVYKIKMNDDKSLMLKARIAAHTAMRMILKKCLLKTVQCLSLLRCTFSNQARHCLPGKCTRLML